MPIEYQQPTKDPRPWFRKKRFLVPIGIFLVFGLIGELTGANDVADVQPQIQTEQLATDSDNSEPDNSEEPELEAIEPGQSGTNQSGTEQPGTEQSDSKMQQVENPDEAVPTESAPESNAGNNQETDSGSAATPVETEQPSSETVLSYVNLLVVTPEVTSGYDRDLFRHWVDDSGNGCDARREALIAESLTPVTVGSRCSLSGGRWYSAFDGVVTTDPSMFDVDHMVPLKEAWDSGANNWSPERRRAFANDLDSPHSLIAVSRSSNRSKGARDPAEWMPPRADYRCEYVYSWTLVKIKWQLNVDSAELQALKRFAEGCLVSDLDL